MKKHLFILTGASRGMGLAMAEQILAADTVLLCIARNAAPVLDRLASSKGAELIQWTADLADASHVAARLVQWLLLQGTRHWETATLINNAGALAELAPLSHIRADDLTHTIRLGIEAPMLLTSAFLRATNQWQPAQNGHHPQRKILNISSGLGRRAMASSGPYCAAKAALDHFSRCVALEEAMLPFGASICALAPGVIDTDMQSQLRSADASQFPDQSSFANMFENGQLTSPAVAAERVLNYLYRKDFGQEPVADVRSVRTT